MRHQLSEGNYTTTVIGRLVHQQGNCAAGTQLATHLARASELNYCLVSAVQCRGESPGKSCLWNPAFIHTLPGVVHLREGAMDTFIEEVWSTLEDELLQDGPRR